MGDAQSAQREANKDAAAAAAAAQEEEEEEESGRVDDAQPEHTIEDKTHGQIAEINGQTDESIAEVNGHCEDEIATEAILLPDEDASGTEKPLKEEKTPRENVELNEKESANEGDANDNVPQEITEVDAKQNDINEGFRKFFSNIGLKLTVKRGSREIATDMPDKTNKDEPNRPEDVEDTTKETKSENAEQNTDVNIAQEAYDNDSTTCPTLTDVPSEDVLEDAEEKTTETKEEVESGNAGAATTSPIEDPQQDATPEEEPHSTSLTSPEEEAVVSPIKRFFTTGIFSGLRKKKKPAEDETTEKELVNMGEKEVLEKTEQIVKDQQRDEGEISAGTEAVAVEDEPKENEVKEELLPVASAQTTNEEKSASGEASTIMTEPEILSSQEKDKVQASPLKRLLSGSSLKKLSKKQKDRKSSEGMLCVSGEQVSDQLLSSTESAENQKREGPAQPSAEAAGEEDSAWASFKKLVTPKKRMKRSSLSNEDTQIPGLVEEPKPSEGEQISDHSTEEGKKRKDSSVSWEAVLCGSGRRRSRKTSDSEEEMPQTDNTDHKQDGGSKYGAESPLESSNENENEILASSPKQASEGDGESTWKSLKRLVTPKRKAKDEDESKDQIQSDNEVTQDESSFSIKKLLPGRKKRKSVEHQDQVSSEEADKDVDSADEDSETPAVVPLSEFDIVETEVHIQTQADIESHIVEEENYELQQELLDQVAEPVKLKTEPNKFKDDDVLEKQAFTTPATSEEPDDLTESIGKHQQLSDIPEEGIITETMATPASVDEEAARDDTIAEDLIEITSEAITAPEPAADITIADETEMISAVSQLSSESSKTSGNTTPVPAEHNVVETDMLLYQAAETISISPKAVPVCSDELSPEKRVASVSQQILETFVKEEPTVLGMHRRADETGINTGPNVEEVDVINELAATSQTESISEVNDFGSTEIVSEVPTEEFDTAEIDVDEIREASITHQEESIKELESIDESHHLVESEINAAAYPDKLPEGDEIVPDASSVVETHQGVTEPPQIDSQEVDSAVAVADESKDGAKEQEVQTVTGDEDYTAEQIQVENKDQPPAEMEELHELAQEQAATLDSEVSVQSLEKEIISEDIPAAKTITGTCELKEETVPQTDEPEKEDELQTDETKTEQVQVPEASEAVQASTLDSQESSVQVPREEAKSEDIPPGETVTDESKQKPEHLTEVNVEPENQELPVTAVKSQHDQEQEVLQAVQAEEAGSVQSLEKEVIPKTETVTDELKEETILVTEVTPEPVDASKTGHGQEQEVIQALQASTLNSEEVGVQSLQKEMKSEDVPEAEAVTDELKEETLQRQAA
uniref:A-kinase anchor protein 12 n=1 Tax=Scatophagus argus TaxID=75038 RepID=UPI001ED808C8|nr:A-kinase anchor protein 12 [Scatophagus argus]